MNTMMQTMSQSAKKSTIGLAALGIAVAFFSMRPAIAEAQTSPKDAVYRIAQIDSTLAAWNAHLSNLYQYIQRDPTAWWYYVNNPGYKAQYDAWSAYEWQRGQQSIKQLQAERAYFDHLLRAQSTPASSPRRPTAPTAGTASETPQLRAGTPGTGATPTGSGAATPGSGTRKCPPGAIELLGVCEGGR